MPNCARCGRPLAGGDAFCPSCGTPNPERAPSHEAAAAPTEILPPDDLQRRLQQALGADYTVEHQIGQGGFALVFAVSDRKLQRRIAVKLLRPEFTASRTSIQRFIREAESAASINHPHILPIFFVGEREGLVYFAMPLVDGETLDAYLRRTGQLPEEEVARIGGEIADALTEAHGRGLVHRDIKPQNVMLAGEKRRTLVMDFGIAKAAAGSGERLTGTGVVIGSPHYMSPEQAGGDPGVDQRSDIYSLGIVLWEMLAGEVPFDGPSTQGIIIQHLTQAVPNIRVKRPGVSAALANVVARATAKKKEDRFQSAGELADALRHAGAGAGARALAWRLPRPLALGLAAAAVVLVAAGAILWRRAAGAAEAAAHAVPPDNSPMVAALPFEALGESDQAQFGRTAVRLLTDALDRRHVPTVDDEELLGHWSRDRLATADPLEKKAAFALEHGANEMLIGSATLAGRQLQLSVDVYDARNLANIGSAAATGSPDSLFGLMDRVATGIAGVLCGQPDYNPDSRCYDEPARPVRPLAVGDVVKPGEAQPSPPTLLVKVDSAGAVDSVRLKTPSSHDDVNDTALALARAVKYLPARRHGRPVTAWAAVAVAVTTSADTAVAHESACAEPGTYPAGSCYDNAPAPQGQLKAAWNGNGSPSPAQLWLHIRANGTVGEVRVAAASNAPKFTEAAKRAARQLRFTPATKGSTPVAAWTRVSISRR